MKTWTVENSWDEIIDRLEELESFELPFNQRLIRFPDKEGCIVHELDKKAVFNYQICNYYPCIQVWYGPQHSLDEIQYIAIANIDNKGVEGSFATKKEAMVYCLNKWEKYMFDKQYLKDKVKFDENIERLYKEYAR